ncbi:hypothetical protein [Anaerobacillus alkalilacustris]|uniref:hypothetical protein n=1 Tax=Anaerobacillus alkalilacustris TaxID=393763 RepID=UPI001471013F|nr:hypothetical protein [Anaerobacillus alkalilacustris]
MNKEITDIEKPYSKIAELLGRPQPNPEDIHVNDKGVIIIEVGRPNINKLVRKALSL